MTRLQIRNLIRKRLGETTAAFWSDSELNTWINDAGKDICEKTKCRRTSDTYTPTAEIAEYTLSSIFDPVPISILKVYYYKDATSWDKLEYINREDLDALYPGWMSADSGTPSHYYVDYEENLFGLYVKPNSTNAGTNYLKAYYAYGFTALTDDNNSPAIPEFLHMAVCDFVVALGFEQRGWGDKANDAWSKYVSRCMEYRIEREREKEDEELIMKPIRNIS